MKWIEFKVKRPMHETSNAAELAGLGCRRTPAQASTLGQQQFDQSERPILTFLSAFLTFTLSMVLVNKF